ncbi:hypothetical protein DOZ80_08885 [Pseudomonas fluorescens]|uniref:Uncharacterized protein n=1 Tax=Pseudomonas fluorescens TaxID=294 RepID=A0A327NAN6_PSEFL|nr:DUF6388 family protein [Pseudomonas fluorescens]RAI71935.1 hypothetical protein DOZ80_08885 [Pseudomonas fluorescens]
MDLESRYKAASAKYFAQNPAVSREIEAAIAANLAGIQAVGSTVEQEREQRQIQVFAAEAKARGLDIYELVIRLMADSPEQALEWRLEHHRQIADSLGMDWGQYKTLNLIG